MSVTDGIGDYVKYQPQHWYDFGDWAGFTNLGEETLSKRNAMHRLNLYLQVHPGTQVRILKVECVSSVLTEEADTQKEGENP